MAGNDYRAGRAVLHCVVDEGLYGAVKGLAAVRGVSVTRLVTDALEGLVGPRDTVPSWAAAVLSKPAPVTTTGDVSTVSSLLVRDPLEEIA